MEGLNLIIAGSRHLRVSFNFIMSKLVFFELDIQDVASIYTGEAPGIDYCGKMFAAQTHKPHRRFPYKSELGKAGGPVRNAEMADAANVNGKAILLLIWDGNSRGSNNMKFEARKRGIPVMEVILRRPLQADMKRLDIYKKPKERVSEVNKSNSDNIALEL